MLDDIKICGIEGIIEHHTPSSAVYTLLKQDDGRGSTVIGSLDVHHPCEDRAFFCATLVIDQDFAFVLSPSELAELLPEVLGLSATELWDIRIWKAAGGATQDNDPRVFRR